MDKDIDVVDSYLKTWDAFAQGNNSLVPTIKDGRADFEKALARLLTNNDRRAAARLVFYAVVQVGAGIPAASELGKAARSVLTPDFPITKLKGSDEYFASDLYFWWQENEKNFEHFPVLDDWQKREFARTTVIPMYTRLRSKK